MVAPTYMPIIGYPAAWSAGTEGKIRLQAAFLQRHSAARDRRRSRGSAGPILADQVGISAAQLAVLWCKDQPGITAPLLGTRTLEHLEHLLPVAEMKLDDETRAACDRLVPPGSVVANFHNTACWMKTSVPE